MTVSLLLPIGLAALAALLLPLLVHLARRNEQRLVVFAALRWLQANAQPQRKHRFDEILLLVLRLLLLAALALLLAEPVLFGQPDLTARVLVAPGVDAAAVRDRIGADDASWHWAAPGLPVIDDDQTRAPDRPPANTPSFSSLLREMDATLPAGAPLTVLVPPVLAGADAERPLLSRPVEWRIVPGNDSEAAESVVPSTTTIPTLMVRHAPERADSLRYLRAASAAWLAAREDTVAKPAAPVTIAPASTPLDPDQQHLIWLVPGPLPDAVREWIAAGGEALLDVDTVVPELADAAVVWRGPDGPLVRAARLGGGRIMQLQHELRPAAMPVLLEPDFPIQLQGLFTEPPPPPIHVEASAHVPRTGLPAYPETPRPLAPWLAALVALLFLIERWVANGPRRRAVA